MKKTLAILLVVTMMLAGAEPLAWRETINITVFHYMAQATKQAGLEAISLTANCIPTLPSPTYTIIRGTDYFPQLSTALSSGDQPNIIMGNPGLYPDLVSERLRLDPDR